MADVNHSLREMEEQLHPLDIQEIKYLLKDTLSSKYDNYVILSLFLKKTAFRVFWSFERYASLE